MSPSLEQALNWANYHSTELVFAVLWVGTTATVAFCVGLAVGPTADPVTPTGTMVSSNASLIWRRAWDSTVVKVMILLSAFVVLYATLMLSKEAFHYCDDSVFTLTTLRGHNIRLWIYPHEGRFMPLAFQEFNIARHFTNTITGYHAIPILEVLLMSGILLCLDDEINVVFRGMLIIIAFMAPSILLSFMNLLFSERNILLFLVCFALSVKRFEQTMSIAWALSTVIFAQLMIYSKETTFLLLFGFAVLRLMLRCRNSQLTGWDFGRLRVRESRLDLGLAALAMLFLLFYVGFMGLHGNMNYANSTRIPFSDVVLGYMKVDLLPWLLTTALLGRLYLILWRGRAPLLLWDGLAAGGVAYFLAYLYLSIFRVYYLGPADLIAVLYVGRFAVLSWQQIPSWNKGIAITLALIFFFQDALVSAFTIFERKEHIQGNAEIVSVIETQYWQNAGSNLRLFFPFARSYVIFELAAYLNYQGIPVEGAADEAYGPNSVVLAEARDTRMKRAPGTPVEDGPCVEWNTIRCRVVNEPAPGDLVIVLPDDKASLTEVSMYRNAGVLLFYSDSLPSIPHWLRWLFDHLPVEAQSRYRSDALPDRWMDRSVTLWK
jgi:hypothetical protein